MSNAFAIAAVSAVLRNLLNTGLGRLDLAALGNWSVSTLPPDRALANNDGERNQINLFMYHATTNQGWAHFGLPARDAAGQRLTNPPLALDLHYLLIAYGREELHAETLLGAAMQILHENPVLTRAFISQTFTPGNHPPPEITMVAGSGLADQVELIKICPQPLNTEELSKLWAAFQSRYRPTAAYCLSVVLVESDAAVRAPLPVLKRGEEDTGPRAFADLIPPYPTLEEVALPNHQISAAIGDLITLQGHHLAGASGKPGDVTVTAGFSHPRSRRVPAVGIPLQDRTSASARFRPVDPAIYPAGVYTVHLAVTPVADVGKQQDTNDLALVIAPRITSPMPMMVARMNVDLVTGLGDATINLTCSPHVLPEQHVTLVIGDREIGAEPHPAQTDALTFRAGQMAAGEYRVRLRVDGIESHLVDRSTPGKPKFDETQKVTLT
jgi:hypothetical protein